MKTSERKPNACVKRLLALVAMLAAAAIPAEAATDLYHATFVEPYGGPNQTPFSCPPGTSCGSANAGQLGAALFGIEHRPDRMRKKVHRRHPRFCRGGPLP